MKHLRYSLLMVILFAQASIAVDMPLHPDKATVVDALRRWADSLSYTVATGTKIVVGSTTPDGKPTRAFVRKSKRNRFRFETRILADDRYCIEMGNQYFGKMYRSWTGISESFYLPVHGGGSSIVVYVDDEKDPENRLSNPSAFAYRDTLQSILSNTTWVLAARLELKEGHLVSLGGIIEIDSEMLVPTKIMEGPNEKDSPSWYDLDRFQEVGGVLYPFRVREHSKLPHPAGRNLVWHTTYIFDSIKRNKSLSVVDIMFPRPENCIVERNYRTDSNFPAISKGINKFWSDTGRYPGTLKELYAPSAELSSLGGPWIQTNQLIDPWGKKIRYKLLKHTYEIRSAGSDGVFNTDWDITIGPIEE